MSHTIVNSCRLFHTIIICNMKSLPCSKLEILEFAQKLPGHAQILKVSISWEPIFSWPEIFRECSSHYFLPFLKLLAKSNEAISRKWPKTAILETNCAIIWRHFFFSKIGLCYSFKFIAGYLDEKIRKI